MTPHLISADDVKKVLKDNYVVYVKYIRTKDTYRFALDADWCTPNHVQMVDTGETAISAGSFKLYRDRFEWENSWSMTLAIGSLPDDETNLTELFYGGVQRHALP